MIYRGTNFTERIQISPMDRMNTTQWIEMRRFADSHEFEVFLCDDYGDHRNVWSWWFSLDKPMTYEQIKFNIMENMFGCDTMEEFAEVLDEVFEDGFEGVLISSAYDDKKYNFYDTDEDEFEDECDCEHCECCCGCEEELEHHDPEYVMTLKLGKDNDVWVDILDAGDIFEAWLYRKNMGIKEYMFGWPKVQHPKSGGVEYYDLDAFIDLVCGNVEEYLEFYDEEYGD